MERIQYTSILWVIRLQLTVLTSSIMALTLLDTRWKYDHERQLSGTPGQENLMSRIADTIASAWDAEIDKQILRIYSILA